MEGDTRARYDEGAEAIGAHLSWLAFRQRKESRRSQAQPQVKLMGIAVRGFPRNNIQHIHFHTTWVTSNPESSQEHKFLLSVVKEMSVSQHPSYAWPRKPERRLRHPLSRDNSRKNLIVRIRSVSARFNPYRYVAEPESSAFGSNTTVKGAEFS